MKSKIMNLVLIVIMLIISNCKSDDEGSPKGFNETCIPLSFPGLTVSIDGDWLSDVDPLSQEYQDYIACVLNCAITNPDDIQCIMNCMITSGLAPAGGAFPLRLEITNNTDGIIQFSINSGTWLFPSSDSYQPMLVAMPISIPVPANQTVNTIFSAFCLASSKEPPDMSSEYTCCNTISSNGCLSDIMTVLETKDMNAFTYQQNLQVQMIIWNCIEGENVDMAYLNGLPD